MMGKSWGIAALLMCVLASACGKEKEGRIPESDMVDLLADLQIAQAYYSSPTGKPGTMRKEELMESVLEKHGVTQEELDSTIAYYGRNMDEYYALYEKVEKNLKTRNGQAEHNNVKDDIWPYGRFAAIFPHQMNDGIIFSFPAQGLRKGNSLDLQMRMSSPVQADVTFGVEYEEGVASMVSRNSSGGDRKLEVKLFTDTAYTPKRIFGSVKIDRSSMPLWIDSIQILKSRFDSLEYSRIRQQRTVSTPKPKPPRQTQQIPINPIE